MTKQTFRIRGKEVTLSNLDKTYFPRINGTKAELVDYYLRMAPYILPYLKNRPFSMLHYPHGVEGESFFMKRRPPDAPAWLKSVPIASKEKEINWCLVNDVPSLAYMANRSCIEMHAWFSRLPHLDKPNVAIFDLDPSGNTGFEAAAEAALLVKQALDVYKLWAIPKLSGKTGVHVVVPIRATAYETVREFLSGVCAALEQARPDLCTTQRTVSKRGDKVYLDAVQNARGQTLPSPYSVRATPNATVSAPVTWQELARGAKPEQFHMRNIHQRVERLGDLFAPVYKLRQRLPPLAPPAAPRPRRGNEGAARPAPPAP